VNCFEHPPRFTVVTTAHAVYNQWWMGWLDFPDLELGELVLKLADEVSTLNPKLIALAEDIRKLVQETF
jgi:hypothetical protein